MPSLQGSSGAIFHDDTSPLDQFRQAFPFCAIEHSNVADKTIVEVLIRPTVRCNQKCPFCSAHDTREATEHDVKSCLSAISTLFPDALATLTGGEPTLRHSFLQELQWALTLQALTKLQVQTNAVSFANRLDANAIAHSDRLSFFVSLHGMDEHIYDACTGTTGQLLLAKAGIHNLLNAGHNVTINCVANAFNIESINDYVKHLASEFGSCGQLDLHFSALICPENRPDTLHLLVPYRRLALTLESACALAQSLGLSVQSLRSSTHAALPACVLSENTRNSSPHRAHPSPLETSFEPNALTPWRKSITCRTCKESDSCLGVPAPYAQRFGFAELEPLK
jgi:MoaA/NifB/PqqE/SkfB family radical SAM enzyme